MKRKVHLTTYESAPGLFTLRYSEDFEDQYVGYSFTVRNKNREGLRFFVAMNKVIEKTMFKKMKVAEPNITVVNHKCW